MRHLLTEVKQKLGNGWANPFLIFSEEMPLLDSVLFSISSPEVTHFNCFKPPCYTQQDYTTNQNG